MRRRAHILYAAVIGALLLVCTLAIFSKQPTDTMPLSMSVAAVASKVVVEEQQNNNDTLPIRPRTGFIKAAPAIILLIAACVFSVIAVVLSVIVFIKRAFFTQESRFFMCWCFVILAIYTTAVTYLCASQNQFVFRRNQSDVIFSPFIVNNIITWLLVLFLITQFCQVQVAIMCAVFVMGVLGVVVQGMASFADDGVQWGLYVLGAVPLVAIPVILCVNMNRRRKQHDRKDWFGVLLVLAVAVLLRLVYTVTDLAGHSFGGRYQGLGISDEIALQVLQNAFLIFFMQALSYFTLSPQSMRTLHQQPYKPQSQQQTNSGLQEVSLLSAPQLHGQ
jgi:hypothetical protein